MTELSIEQAQRLYEEEGIKGFEKQGIPDATIIHELGRKVMARECLLPALKVEGWSWERVRKAEVELGVGDENLELFRRQYSLLDNAELQGRTLMDLAKYLASEYDWCAKKN